MRLVLSIKYTYLCVYSYHIVVIDLLGHCLYSSSGWPWIIDLLGSEWPWASYSFTLGKLKDLAVITVKFHYKPTFYFSFVCYTNATQCRSSWRRRAVWPAMAISPYLTSFLHLSTSALPATWAPRKTLKNYSHTWSD